MAYNELIKNFERTRGYMREFYVYGFKSREDYSSKSARSYDDERRRIESWLGDYMSFQRTADGKNMFLAINSRSCEHNPLYKAWKSKSFTDGDITLHFILFDILHSPDISLTLAEITEMIDSHYLSGFSSPMLFDESTVRKKLKEYADEGLILTQKQGRKVFYCRNSTPSLGDLSNALNFFSETLPCGVIGSFLLDKTDSQSNFFSFKHHYITHTLDSDILCIVFDAMSQKRAITIQNTDNRFEDVIPLVPLRIFISSQNGRQYLMAYHIKRGSIRAYRLDLISKITVGDVCEKFDMLRCRLDNMQKHMWGINFRHHNARTQHVEFTVHTEENEPHIFKRLEREKRCGTVERIDEHTCRYCADVYDINEMLPWIRTFICRITDINFSDKKLEAQFRADLEEMYRLYDID